MCFWHVVYQVLYIIHHLVPLDNMNCLLDSALQCALWVITVALYVQSHLRPGVMHVLHSSMPCIPSQGMLAITRSNCITLICVASLSECINEVKASCQAQHDSEHCDRVPVACNGQGCSGGRQLLHVRPLQLGLVGLPASCHLLWAERGSTLHPGLALPWGRLMPPLAFV